MNNRITVILIIVLLVGIGGIVYISIAEPFQKVLRACALWVGKPKVVYGDITPDLWFLRGHDKGPVDYAYKKATGRLVEVLKAHSSWRIDENYCIRYVNPYNNTIVIVSKSLDDEVKQAFLDVMKPPEKVTVLFRKGPASSIELNEWKNVIIREFDTLRERGVFCQSLGITENGTIGIGVLNLNKEKVRIILTVLRGKVPPGILVIENESQITISPPIVKPEKHTHVKIAVTYLSIAPETTIIPPPPSAKNMEALVQMGEDDINAYCAENNISYSFDFIPKPVLYSGETPGLEETKELKSDGVDLIVGHDFEAACRYSLEYVNYHDMLMLSPISSPLYLRIMDDHLFFFVPHPEAHVYSKMFKELNVDVIVVVGPKGTDMYYLFDNLSKSFVQIGGTVYYYVSYRLTELSFDRCLEKTESKVQEALREYDANHVGIAVILWGIETNTIFFEQVENHTTLSEVFWFRLWGTPKEFLIVGSKEPFCVRHACLQIVMKPKHTPKYETFQQRYRELTNSTVNLFREYDQAARYDAMWLMALSVIEVDSCYASAVKTVLPEVAANYVGVIGPCPLDENGDGQMFDYDVMGWLETEPGVYEFVNFGYYDAVEDDFVWYEDYLTLLREKIGN